MREFLNLCNEDMAWLVFVINGFVIFFLTDEGRFTNNPSIKWKVRFLILPVIFGEMCLLCRKLPWDFEYTGMRIVLSLVFWYAFLFPLKNKENKS